MTVLDRSRVTPEDVLRAVWDLAPTIAARAGEVEAARRVPPDLLDELVAAGCFRLLPLPRRRRRGSSRRQEVLASIGSPAKRRPVG